MLDKPELLHVFGPGQWHDDVTIVGNTDALTRLRDQINEVLDNKGPLAHNHLVTPDQIGYSGEPMTTDGEGFNVNVVKVDDALNDPLWNNLAFPYSSEYACGSGPGSRRFGPHVLIKLIDIFNVASDKQRGNLHEMVRKLSPDERALLSFQTGMRTASGDLTIDQTRLLMGVVNEVHDKGK